MSLLNRWASHQKHTPAIFATVATIAQNTNSYAVLTVANHLRQLEPHEHWGFRQLSQESQKSQGFHSSTVPADDCAPDNIPSNQKMRCESRSHVADVAEPCFWNGGSP